MAPTSPHQPMKGSRQAKVARLDATLYQRVSAFIPREDIIQLQTSPPAKPVRLAVEALRFGHREERQQAAATFACLAASSVEACNAIMVVEAIAALAAVLAAANHHEADVLLLATCAVHHLARHPQFRSELAERDVCGSLVALLQPEGSLDTELRLEAAASAEQLALDENAATRLLESGASSALQALVGAGQAAGEGELVLRAVRALRATAACTKNLRFLFESVQAGVIAWLVPLSEPPPDDAPPAAAATHVAALGLLERLCALQPFQTLLESEGSIFNLLFRLRDHRADEVRDLAEEIARHWEGTFFGWSWRCDVHLCDRHVVGQPQVPTACAPRETAAFDRHLRPPRVTATCDRHV